VTPPPILKNAGVQTIGTATKIYRRYKNYYCPSIKNTGRMKNLDNGGATELGKSRNPKNGTWKIYVGAPVLNKSDKVLWRNK